MFTRQKPEPADIDVAIAAAHTFLEGKEPHTDEYKKATENLSALYKMKESLKDPTSKFSKDAVLAAAASVGSVALILIFEGVGRGIITTKSLGFTPKPKNKN